MIGPLASPPQRSTVLTGRGRGLLLGSISVFAFMVLGWAVAHAAPLRHLSCPPPPVPSSAKVSLVARRIRVDGIPMAILTIASPEPREVLIGWYRKEWTNLKGEPRYIVYPIGAYQVIAHKAGSCFITVQLAATREGASGFVAVSNESDVEPLHHPPAAFAFAGATVLLHDASDDGGKIGRTWVMTTRAPLSQVVSTYVTDLRRHGWHVVSASLLRAAEGRQSYVTDWQRGRRLLHAVFSRRASGQSAIVLVEVIRP